MLYLDFQMLHNFHVCAAFFKTVREFRNAALWIHHWLLHWSIAIPLLHGYPLLHYGYYMVIFTADPPLETTTFPTQPPTPPTPPPRTTPPDRNIMHFYGNNWVMYDLR